MKIRIITIHGIPNFGSVFQSYALCAYLKSQGYSDTKIIDYNPQYFDSKSPRAIIGKFLNYGNYLRRTRKFRSFIEKNLDLTAHTFRTIDELREYNFDADVYIAGGDQLWNVYHASGNDDAYKLTWVVGKKISYATSMGQTDFSHEKIRELAEKISDFSSVSVRESSSVSMLRTAGINATHCVDPVFLLEKNDYDKYIKPVDQPPYLLVYLVSPSQLLNKAIEVLSKKYGLKVILCSGFSKKCPCDQFLKDLGPDEILSYIKHADIVLASSFHATAFSVIFKKKFFTILPDKHTNERILDFLSNVNLRERIITKESQLQNIDNLVIDYEKFVFPNHLIESSKAYLSGAINND